MLLEIFDILIVYTPRLVSSFSRRDGSSDFVSGTTSPVSVVSDLPSLQLHHDVVILNGL